ncbi:MAG: ABC transporter ATP-binding protein [Allgaiera sp.]|jgi:branched-chain amino acid transport system ATP-binding protein|nr:ABC transporter ATP-binding protein [Allgaiera sp.]
MTTPTLQLDGLNKRFGHAHIIRDVSLDVPQGERHAIIGPNGAGKSTLFNLISGRFAPSAGHVRLGGREIGGKAAHRIRHAGLSRSFQVTNIFPRLTVYQTMQSAVLWSLGYRYNFWRPIHRMAEVARAAEALIQMIGLEAQRDISGAELSYADQRALEIGITIAGDPDVILLDEPTAGMSRGETEHAVALIRRVTDGKTLLMVEHDMDVVFDLADRISVLVYGQIIATGTPEEIRANPDVRRAYLGATPEDEAAATTMPEEA